MSTITVTVTGMSCGHCAESVREEVSSTPGVIRVDVDDATGDVAIDTSGEVGVDVIKRAVEQAGYRLAG